MVFSSLTFLSVALPLALIVYYLLPRRMRNGWLLLFSLAFYAWGEPLYILLMIGCILVNWAGARAMASKRGGARRALLIALLAVDLGALCAFKYVSMLVGILNAMTGLALPAPNIPLPIGISFFTFQTISYGIDVYRGRVAVQKRLSRLALYISFFPQLIAGPIVRYADVAAQIENRRETADAFARGVVRFVAGLGKKVLLANELARVADEAFASGGALSLGASWLGIICYALQIYFDFSGYSDMALGLGGMFGFRFPENFRHPYCAASIREFWNRWHITLSTWFRDYVYIPLGGSRVKPARHALNLMTVFLLTGLWHGAGATFLCWGAYHGVLRVLESFVPKQKRPIWLGVPLTFLAVLIGWVVFRADTLPDALAYYRALLGLGGTARLFTLTPRALLALLLATLGATPLPGRMGRWLPHCARGLLSLICAILCLLSLASASYNPFIYFRF